MTDSVMPSPQTGQKPDQAKPKRAAWEDFDEELDALTKVKPPQAGKSTEQSAEQKPGQKKSQPGLPRPIFWKIVGTMIDHGNRDQQVEIAKLMAGNVGATLTFPNAREGVLRQENAKLSEKLGAKAKVGPKAKPENQLMKGTTEEKYLHMAQKSLRELKLSLGLAKDNKTDPRLADAVKTLGKAKAEFDAKKASVKNT